MQFFLTIPVLTILNIHTFQLTNSATHVTGKNDISWTRSKELKYELFMLHVLICTDLSGKTPHVIPSQRWKDSITWSFRHINMKFFLSRFHLITVTSWTNKVVFTQGKIAHSVKSRGKWAMIPHFLFWQIFKIMCSNRNYIWVCYVR